MRCPARITIRLLVPVAVGVAGVFQVQAQQPSPAPIERQVQGTWEGVFQSDHVPPGPLRLVVARDSAWRVRIELRANEQDFFTDASAATLEGNILSWRHEMMGQPCRGMVVLKGGLLKGETTCGEGGLSFTLTRLPPARGGSHE